MKLALNIDLKLVFFKLIYFLLPRLQPPQNKLTLRFIYVIARCLLSFVTSRRSLSL